jgi:zinc transport system substrate-binding protein
MPGAARVAAIRDRLRAGGVVCVFAEPQFEPKLLGALVEGTGVRTGVLDPLGAGLEPGPALYAQLLRGLAAGLAECLGG